MKKVWIDTDIGTDVDDLLALIYALKNPELKVMGASTVIGDSEKRAKIAAETANLLGKAIEAAPGANLPMLSDGKNYWCGYEGDGMDLQKTKIGRPATACLQNIVTDPSYTIACIAPMTNIATAANLSGSLILAELYIMGQAGSHNFRVDKPASDIVKYCSTGKTLVTTDVAKKVYLTKEEMFGLKTGNAELDKAIYTNAGNWLKHSPYKDRFYLYDPLTVAAVARPDLLKFENISGIRTSVSVKADKFKEHFLEILTS
ncbi:MAG: nucleoside hydrolase [DPANN group archaeon]|nr:nucleoside hydrolase [DPANN group archaeon]